jgi:hypothetical protein
MQMSIAVHVLVLLAAASGIVLSLAGMVFWFLSKKMSNLT